MIDLLPDVTVPVGWVECSRAVGGGSTPDPPARFTSVPTGSGLSWPSARAAVVRQGRAASAVLYRYFSGVETVGYEWAYGSGSALG